MPIERRAEVSRRTRETDIRVSLDIDGRGVARVKTGIRFLDHLLTSLAVHGRFDLEVEATSLDQCAHHLVEDVAIVLGRALKSALGDKRGIRRFGYALVPMDEALVLVAVDLSGRGYAEVEVEFDRDVIDGMDARLIRHLLGSMALNAGLTLHAMALRGSDDHHKAESLFKSLGVSLHMATRTWGPATIPSSKGVLE